MFSRRLKIISTPFFLTRMANKLLQHFVLKARVLICLYIFVSAVFGVCEENNCFLFLKKLLLFLEHFINCSYFSNIYKLLLLLKLLLIQIWDLYFFFKEFLPQLELPSLNFNYLQVYSHISANSHNYGMEVLLFRKNVHHKY